MFSGFTMIVSASVETVAQWIRDYAKISYHTMDDGCDEFQIRGAEVGLHERGTATIRIAARITGIDGLKRSWRTDEVVLVRAEAADREPTSVTVEAPCPLAKGYLEALYRAMKQKWPDAPVRLREADPEWAAQALKTVKELVFDQDLRQGPERLLLIGEDTQFELIFNGTAQDFVAVGHAYSAKWSAEYKGPGSGPLFGLDRDAAQDTEVVHAWFGSGAGAWKTRASVVVSPLPGDRAKLLVTIQARDWRWSERRKALAEDWHRLYEEVSTGGWLSRSARESHQCEVDMVVLTVLPEEYKAVRNKLINPRLVRPPQSERNLYAWTLGEIPVPRTKDSYSVILGITGRAGTSTGALATKEAVLQWAPRYVFFVGIAGGLEPARVSLGDVVVADIVYGYEYGKLGNEFIARQDWTYRTDQSLYSAAIAYGATDQSWLNQIEAAPPEETKSKLLPGRVASGDKVVDNPTHEFFKTAMEKYPDALAVEMEGVGAAKAIEESQSSGRPVGFLMIRGISDLPTTGPRPEGGGARQRDRWKGYASDAAAAFTAAFIANGLPTQPVEASFATDHQVSAQDRRHLQVLQSEEQFHEMCNKRDQLRALLADEQEMRDLLSSSGPDATRRGDTFAKRLMAARSLFGLESHVAIALQQVATAVSSAPRNAHLDFTNTYHAGIGTLNRELRRLMRLLGV